MSGSSRAARGHVTGARRRLGPWSALLVLAVLIATFGPTASQVMPPLFGGQQQLAQALAMTPKQHWGAAEPGGEVSGGEPNQAEPVSEQSKFPPASMPPRSAPKANVAEVSRGHTDVRGFDPATSTELPGRRGARERTFRNTDGTLTTQFSQAPVNYQKPGGDWEVIDTTLIEDHSGQSGTHAGWRNTADAIEVHLPSTLGDGQAVRLRYDEGHELALGARNAAVAGRADGSVISYPGAREHADVRVEARPGGLAETLVLNAADAPSSWLLPLQLKGLSAKTVHGDVQLVDEKGQLRAGLGSGTVTEGDGLVPATPGAVRAELVQDGPGQALKVDVDPVWLADPSRRFPVSVAVAVDPSKSNSNMVVVNGGTRIKDTKALAVGRQGSSYSSTYLAFDGLTDPNNPQNILNHKVFGAQLWLVNYNAASCDPRPMTVHPVTAEWGPGASGEPAYGAALAESSFAHGYIRPLETVSACPTAGEGIDLGVPGRDVVQGWATGSQRNFGLTLRAPDAPGTWKQFAGLGTSNPPTLFVTHTPYNADYRVDRGTPEPYVTEGQNGKVQITVTNTGAGTWSTTDYALAYRAFHDDGSPFASREAASLPADVPPGGSVTLDAEIGNHMPPDLPGGPAKPGMPRGKYFFDFSMIKRNGTYFTDEQIPPARIAFEVFPVPPAPTSMYPPNGYSSPTLRPALWAQAVSLVPQPVLNLQYNFQVCEHDAAGADLNCVFSGYQTSPTWVPAAGHLWWNKTYWWRFWAKDNQGESPPSPQIAVLTSVPQPEITAHLAGGSSAGRGQDFDAQVGDYFSSAVDASASVVGPPLTVARTYNSLDPRRGGLFGAGWSTSYDMRITPDADGSGNVVLTYPDGQQARFGRNPNNLFAPPPGRFATLNASAGGWQLVDKTRTVYEFDPSGRLTTVYDNDLRTINLSYDPAGHLQTVRSVTSGRTLTFGWTGGHVSTVSTDIVDGKALTWNYSYDGDKLTKVCDPDNHCTAYGYEPGSHYRSAVIDSRPDGYWRLGDKQGSPTALSDVKVNVGKDNGQYKNVTTGVTKSPLAGSSATVASFNGATSAVTLADGQAVKSRNLAVELWFRTTGGGPLFGHQSSPIGQDSTGGVPVLYVGTDGLLRGEFWYDRGAAPIIAQLNGQPVKVNDGAWHHVVLTGAVSSQTLYLDGRNAGSVDGVIQPEGVPYTQIGAAYAQPASAWAGWAGLNEWHFVGDIGEVAYYTHPLGDAAVAAHFAAAQQADTLNKITLPSGRVAASLRYDTVNDRLAEEVDRNGGSWKLGVPTVSGTGTNLVRSTVVTDPGNRWHQYDFDPVKGRILRYIAPSANDTRGDPQHPGNPTPTSAPPCSAPPPPDGGPIWCGGPIGGGPGWVGGPVKGQGVRTYDYDESGYQNTITDENGHRVYLTYDNRGNITQKKTCRTGPSDCIIAYFTYYLFADRPLDPRNDKQIEARDARSSGPADNTYLTRTTYTANGDVETRTTADGVSVRNAYTDGTEPAYPVGGGGNTPAGLLKAATDGRGKTTTYQYYANGDLGQITGPTGQSTRYSYDALGRKLTETQVSDAFPGGVSTTYTYTATSRQATVTAPATTNAVTAVIHTPRATTSYDADGRQTRVEAVDLTGGDPSRISTFEYDDRGRLAKTINAEGKATSHGYDALGNETWTVDALGNKTEYAYTVRNKVSEVRLRAWAGDAPPGGADPNPDLVLATYAYDNAGRMVRHSDAMGRTMIYRYYDDDLLRSVTATGVKDSLKLELENNTYDAAGHLVRKVTAGGRVTTYTIDVVGRVSARTADPDGLARAEKYTYDGGGNVLEVTRSGKPSNYAGFTSSIPEVAAFTYDDAGRQLTATIKNPGGTPDTITTSRTFYNNGLPRTSTDPRGNVVGANPADFTTTYAYDEQGRQTTVTAPAVMAESNGGQPAPARPVAITGYDTFGQATHTKDPLGNITATDFDKVGKPVRRTLPSYTPPGAATAITPTITTAYDDNGNVAAVTDARGNTTRLTYDQLGRVVSTQDPNPDDPAKAGGTWRYTYDRVGEQLSVTDPLGDTVQATYDDLGRRVTQTQLERKPQPAAHTTTYGYDDAGNVTTVTAPSYAVTRFAYDAVNQLITTTSPANVVTQTGYDLANRPLASTDGAGRKRQAFYDHAGRLTRAVDVAPNGAELRSVSATYDAVGNKVGQTDPLGHTTTYAYDALSRLSRQVEPVSDTEAITTSFGYDAAGHPTRYTDGRGNATITTYNTLSLAESVIEPSTTAYPNPADRTWTAGYNAAGLAETLTAPGGVIQRRSYDGLGRLTRETGSGAEAATTDHVRTYDLAGRLLTMDAAGGVDSFTYNDRGQLLTTDGPSGKSSFSYNADGQMTQRTDASGTSTYTYMNGRLWNVADSITGVKDVNGASVSLRYDNAGAVAGLDFASGHKRTYDYDDLGRLKADTTKNTANAGVASIGYDYDLNDHLTAKTTTGTAAAGANTYTYDYAGRLTSWTDPAKSVTAYGWDASGNRVNNNGKTAVFDERNRLQSDADTTYAYTARGTLAAKTTGGLIQKLTFDAFDRMISQGPATYAYDGLDRVVTRNSQGRSYSGQGNTLASDGAATYARGPGGDLVALSQGTDKRFTLSDKHGDLVGSLNPADGISGVVDSASFDPSGKPVGTTGAKRSLGFQGEWTDPDTNQVNMAARWYNPGTGGFNSRDRITLPASPSSRANRYTYGLGASLDFVDPTGTDSIGDACDLGGGRLGRWSSRFWGWLSIPINMVCDAPSTAGECYDTIYRSDGSPCSSRYPPSEDDCKSVKCRGRLSDYYPNTPNYDDCKSPKCRGWTSGSRPDDNARGDNKKRPPQCGSRCQAEKAQQERARRAQEELARKRAAHDRAVRGNEHDAWNIGIPIPDGLTTPNFANFADVVVSSPSEIARILGDLVNVVSDAMEVWNQIKDVVVDAAAPIVHAVDKLTNAAGELTRGRDPPNTTTCQADQSRPPQNDCSDRLVTVYRVEGPGLDGAAGNERLNIDSFGNVAINDSGMLFLNFGNEGRALSYLARRRADPRFSQSVLKSFEVPKSYLERLRSSAVPEPLAKSFPNSPINVDIATPDQYGLRAVNFPDLLSNIVPGSGRIWP